MSSLKDSALKGTPGVLVEDTRAAATREDGNRPELICPNCGAQLAENKCKLLCPNRQCGYSMSCSDFY